MTHQDIVDPTVGGNDKKSDEDTCQESQFGSGKLHSQLSRQSTRCVVPKVVSYTDPNILIMATV